MPGISNLFGYGASSEYTYFDLSTTALNKHLLYQEGYKVYVFTSSTNFYVLNGGEVDYLLVGGGGAGGQGTSTTAGGGGGGGGVITGTKYIHAGNYEITIGAGGVAFDDTGDLRRTSSGNDTKGFNLIAYGGGAGGTTSTATNSRGSPFGGNGSYVGTNPLGTGGGGSTTNAATAVAALGTLGWGYAGGNAVIASRVGGGGGGAGGVGGVGDSLRAGAGGIGRLSNITGTPTYYGGGGAGGATGNSASNIIPFEGIGGLGGGGNSRMSTRVSSGSETGVGYAGTANTGGGGAGGTGAFIGGNGGSGILVIRVRIN